MNLPLLAGGLLVLLGLPHLLPRTRGAPAAGIALWMSVLALRAAVTVGGVIGFMLYLPTSEPFADLSRWCFHAAVPKIAAHLGLSGHAIGDFASLLPALSAFTATLLAGLATLRASRRVGGWLERSAIGEGPTGSIIVSDSDVVVAAAGVRNPRVVVSAGALLSLDEGELAAELQHEWGHVHRRHRLLSIVSVALLGCSRVLPGGRAASRNLHLHLERDADDYAVRMTGDPMALASAICKAAAEGTRKSSAAIALLGSTGVLERLGVLLAGPRAADQGRYSVASIALASILAATSVALLSYLPVLAGAGAAQAHVSLGSIAAC